MESDRLEFFLKEISVSLFTDLSPEDKMFLGKDIQEVLSCSSEVMLNNIKELYESLINTNKSIKEADFYNEFSENQGYQKALQKLDCEIRSHIKLELQMKVFIDSLEEKIAKAMAKKNSVTEANQKVIEKLKNDNLKLKQLIAEKNEELSEYKAGGKDDSESEVNLLRARVAKDSEKVIECERSNLRFKQKLTQSKNDLEFKMKEYEKHKAEFLYLNKLVGGDSKNTTRHIKEKSERTIKESFEVKSSRAEKTPTRADRSISPLPMTYQQKIMQYSKITQSSKKLDKSPLKKILKTDLSRYKSKSRLPIFANKNK